jgi:hypothetical protein
MRGSGSAAKKALDRWYDFEAKATEAALRGMVRAQA